jgi:spore germination protein YaaH
MQVMTYDEHGPGWSAPGPVSGLDWVEQSLTYAASVVPASKLLIGLPAYGYDWDLTTSNAASNSYVGSSINWVDFASVLATPGTAFHWDTLSASPYADYTTTDRHNHEMWYETAQSIEAKARLIGQYGLGGMSMWSLGREDATFWQAVSAGLTP